MQNNEPRIVILEEGEEYTGDQVAVRFLGVEMKTLKITSFKSVELNVGIDMVWSISFCVVYLPEKYKGVSFDTIHFGGQESQISPNLLTEGDTITMELNTHGQIALGLIDTSSNGPV